MDVKERFLDLVRFDTQSNDDSASVPTTETQKAFAQYLAERCREIGMSDVTVSDYSYVYALLPSNIGETDKKLPAVGFIAHMDTSPDAKGGDIRPKIVENYGGGDIPLNENTVLSPTEFPSLNKYVGQDLIVTDGTTLLGADDKAGIAEILTAMEHLIENPAIKHGDIKIAFTPDEEVGKGADHFDTELFAADFAYTVDGGGIGEIEYESFNAARAVITITGKAVHPGSAKNIMVNSAQIGAELANEFPKDETPATTDGRQGYFHLKNINGSVEQTKLVLLIRDFDRGSFDKRKKFVEGLVKKYGDKYGQISLKLHDEYYNMYEKLHDKQHIIDYAKNAMLALNIEPDVSIIRGGTDGSRLSFMGLPCPNIFAGGHNFHGPFEYVPVQSMVAAVDVIVKITELAAL